MKIIDFDKKGNVVRFYLGNDKCEDYWGDDWDDRNATDKVYHEYIKGWVDIAFPLDYAVMDAINDWSWTGDSPFTKESLKNKKSPCIIACRINPEECFGDSFPEHALNANAIKFYFNDPVEKIEQCKNLTVLERWDK